MQVYRGVLSDGQIVAIKRSQLGSMQGSREFKNEVELLSRVHHKNLVKLVGFCFDKGEQTLVYEFIANGTLMDSLSGTFLTAIASCKVTCYCLISLDVCVIFIYFRLCTFSGKAVRISYFGPSFLCCDFRFLAKLCWSSKRCFYIRNKTQHATLQLQLLFLFQTI